jgi:hypothetical protein
MDSLHSKSLHHSTHAVRMGTDPCLVRLFLLGVIALAFRYHTKERPNKNGVTLAMCSGSSKPE